METFEACPALKITVSIRIVADYRLHSCQVTRKLKRATPFEITDIPAIIFMHCWRFVVYYSANSNG